MTMDYNWRVSVVVIVVILLGSVVTGDNLLLALRRTANTRQSQGGRTGHEQTIQQSARGTTPNNLDPDKFLEKYGYLEEAVEGDLRSIEDRRKAIRGFQRVTGLKVTGKLDKATLTKMSAPRCGNPDIIPANGNIPARLNTGRPNKYSAPGYKWRKNHLTYKVLNSSPDMDAGLQRLAFDNAFQYWSRVTPLVFSEVADNNADIKIKFGYWEHGDGPGNSFDGKGGVLAHAFFPEDGSTHFDESETWRWGDEEGTRHLEMVAAHEFGHALGLGHSSVSGALMGPYYQDYNSDLALAQDDINAIRSLYGRHDVGPPVDPRPTTSPTDQPPNSCTTRFGAVYQAHDTKIYIISGKWLWRLNAWAVDPGFPRLAREVYERMPHAIGAAAYSWRTRHTYLFKGNKIYKYYGFNLVQRKTFRQDGYPRNPDAAFQSIDGHIYVFQGSRFWQLDENRFEVSRSSRPISSKWPNLPPNPESAVRLRDGYLYFFKGARYRKYNEYGRQVVQGYPKEKAGPFMGIICGGRYLPK